MLFSKGDLVLQRTDITRKKKKKIEVMENLWLDGKARTKSLKFLDSTPIDYKNCWSITVTLQECGALTEILPINML